MKIVFYNSLNLGALLIKVMTLSWWNHCDMMFNDGTLIGSVALSNGAGHSGVQKTTLAARLYFNHVRSYTIMQVSLDERKAREYAEEQVGKPYDWTGCIGTILRGAVWDNEHSWFCSELVAATCLYAGEPLIDKPERRITPAMLYNSPYLVTVVPVTRT